MLDIVLRLALVAICLVSLGSYARGREPIGRDAGVMLGVLAGLAAFGMAHRGTSNLDGLLQAFGTVLLLAQPALLLRLVAAVQRVPRPIVALAVVGVAVATGTVFGIGLALPTPLGLGLLTWFVCLQVYCVVAFARAASRKGGALRWRLAAVAVGSALLGLTVLVALLTLGRYPRPETPTAEGVVIEVMLVLVGGCYFCGFTPPASLLRLWQMPDIYDFVTHRVRGAQSEEDTLGALARFALKVTGARAAAIALPREGAPGLALRWWGAEPEARSSELLLEPLDGPLARAWTDGQPAVARSQAEMSPGALRLAKEREAQALMVVPIAGVGPASERLGLLAVFGERGWLFPDDDLTLMHALASHAAVLLSNQHLLAEAAAAAEQLQQANAELDGASRAKDEFLATLAHELRNPLAPVRTGLVLLRERRGDGAAFERTLGMMEHQIASMTRLIDDLMDVARIASGKLELRWEWVDLARVVRDTVETIAPSCARAGQHLAVALPPEPAWLRGDPVRLGQVVGNLLGNACRYTQDGGSIAVEVTLEARHVVLTVRDNGRGIPAHLLTRIFELFVQEDHAAGGVGIGLNLVQRLVQLHGGTVEAASAGPGTGSRFTVRLPLAEEPRTGAPQAAGAVVGRPGARGGERRILVVDDNRDAAELLAELLGLDGFAARTAFDGVEALAVGEAFRPDAVLMDLSMPRMNGYEAAVEMRQRPWGRAAILIALSGWGQERDRARGALAGFDHHLTKPVHHDDLLRLLGATWSPNDPRQPT